MIDINGGSKNPVAARLSNFTSRPFSFDGVQCVSIEGVLQSFKFSAAATQQKICLMRPVKAKKMGVESPGWKNSQTLSWKGIVFTRHSTMYQSILIRLYDAVYDEDQTFRSDLLALGDEDICHSVGISDQHNTVLTEAEFISQLNRLRKRAKEEING